MLQQPPQTTVASPYQFKGSYGSSHHWLLRHLQGRVSGRRVLDFGADTGAIGRRLLTTGAPYLVGIEIEPEKHGELRASYHEVHSSLSSLSGQTFDDILLMDVVEHLVDPFAFMKEIRGYVRPGGRVFLSIPNIAHWSVRASLLFGRFEYRSRGILDRTHLQFFTRKRFLELCDAFPDAHRTEVGSTITPVELLLPESMRDMQVITLFGKLRLAIAQALPGLFAYQHVAVLTASSILPIK